jgi:transposase-like protein
VRLTWNALLHGLLRPTGRCPHCGSDQTRPSRETYAGRLAALLGVQPHRCKSCLRHFAVPFGGRGALLGLLRPARSRAPRCPECRSFDTLSSHREGAAWPGRLLARQGYRCRACRFRWTHTYWREVAINFLVFAIVAGGLALGASYVANRLPQRPKPAPRIRSVPPLPPPAAR